MNIKMDLVRDIQAYIDNDEFTHKNKDGKNIRVSRHFEKHTKDLRDVKTVAREVKFANSFNCPDSLQSNLDIIIQKARNGESLAQHISNNYKKSSVPDSMLYEWNINHLHLHIPHQNDLLFCIIADTVFYAIAIGIHGQWEDENIYEAAYKNWPELFIELNGVTPAKLTREQRKTLRTRHVNAMMGINGKAVAPRGVTGITATGHPSFAYVKTMHDFRLLNGIKENSEAWTEHAKVYIQRAMKINRINSNCLDVKLEIIVEEGGLSLYFLCTAETNKQYRMLYDRWEAKLP